MSTRKIWWGTSWANIPRTNSTCFTAGIVKGCNTTLVKSMRSGLIACCLNSCIVVFAATDTCLVKSSKRVNSYLKLPVPVSTNSGLCSLNSSFKSYGGGRNWEHERRKSDEISPIKRSFLRFRCPRFTDWPSYSVGIFESCLSTTSHVRPCKACTWMFVAPFAIPKRVTK